MKNNKLVIGKFIVGFLFSVCSIVKAEQSDFERGYNEGAKSCSQNQPQAITIVQTYYECNQNKMYRITIWSNDHKDYKELGTYPDSAHNLWQDTCEQARAKL